MAKIICKKTGQEYEVLPQEIDLLEKISPVLGWKKYLIPISKFHPDVIHQQHLSRRNERNLYKTSCALTGKSIITNLNPSYWYTVYYFKDRRSDKRNPMDYGIVFDSQKTFTEQFGDMFSKMPQISLHLGFTLENCDYCNYGMDSKDCYMCSSPTWAENCYYSSFPFRSYYDVDGHADSDCRYCYASRYAMNCYKCQYAIHSYDCRSCKYVFDCRDCEFCFGCVNANHKKYCIFNVQYDKQTYFQKLAELEKESPDASLQKFINFSLKFPRRATRCFQAEGSTGDFHFHTRNCINCFDMQNARDCINTWTAGIESSDFLDCTFVGISSQRYSSIGTALSHSSALDIGCNNLYQCFYCYYCRDCEYCLGCVRLFHKKYCIFNKQYTPEEYEKELIKIITKMQETWERWEFFDPSISPYPYNDSCAYERFHETKEQVESRGGKFIEREQKKFTGEKFNPEPIAVYKNDPAKRKELLDATLTCEVTGAAFRLTEQEVDFYIKFDIPIPQKQYLQRYKERWDLRNLPRKLRDRTCMKCWNDIKTSYNPERKEIVRCESCYDKEIYW